MLGQSSEVVSRLNGLFSLSHVVTITLPSTVNIDGIASQDTLSLVYDRVIATMAQAFGGVTLYDAQGAWYSDTLGKVVSEGVKIAQSYCADLDDTSITLLIDLAESVKADLLQESVLLTLDGRAYLV